MDRSRYGVSGLLYIYTSAMENDTPLSLTIVYEPGDDGWITVSIPEVPGVLSQGRTRGEAREMILSALNDWLRFYVDDQSADRLREIAPDADTEPVRLSFAA